MKKIIVFLFFFFLLIELITSEVERNEVKRNSIKKKKKKKGPHSISPFPRLWGRNEWRMNEIRVIMNRPSKKEFLFCFVVSFFSQNGSTLQRRTLIHHHCKRAKKNERKKSTKPWKEVSEFVSFGSIKFLLLSFTL